MSLIRKNGSPMPSDSTRTIAQAGQSADRTSSLGSGCAVQNNSNRPARMHAVAPC